MRCSIYANCSHSGVMTASQGEQTIANVAKQASATGYGNTVGCAPTQTRLLQPGWGQLRRIPMTTPSTPQIEPGLSQMSSKTARIVFPLSPRTTATARWPGFV